MEREPEVLTLVLTLCRPGGDRRPHHTVACHTAIRGNKDGMLLAAGCALHVDRT
jgi:hypothetical protein